MIAGFIVALIAPWLIVAALAQVPFPYNIAAAISMAVSCFGGWIVLGYIINKH